MEGEGGADSGAPPVSPPRPKRSLQTRAEKNILEAEKLKAKGNEFFKRGKMRKAIYNYNKVFLYVRGLPSQDMAGYAMQLGQGSDYQMMTSTNEERANRLQVVSYTNIANCYFKLKDYRQAKENAAKALEIDPTHVKATLRKCQACLMLKDLDATAALKAELDAAVSANPALSKSFAAPLAAIANRYAAEYKAYEAKQRKAMKKMFS
jgi:tetratricopeptide (TPR) repeat protein